MTRPNILSTQQCRLTVTDDPTVLYLYYFAFLSNEQVAGMSDKRFCMPVFLEAYVGLVLTYETNAEPVKADLLDYSFPRQPRGLASLPRVSYWSMGGLRLNLARLALFGAGRTVSENYLYLKIVS